MAYLSLYRKYRSQSFSEVSGQEHVTRTLQNALRQGRVSHAYLFSGPRGTGKTSTARLLARALNCEEGPGPTPCGDCTACREIRDGVSPSVIEIDAASSRGIDEIRDLRQRVMTVPSQAGARKVFIVDEVHMLTTEACNALLKTLEEPPAHVLFVLATTDAQKLPATILSRCQRFEFRRGSVGLVGERLKYVAEAEGYRLEPEAARLLARASGGSWRDAISLLEQVLSFSTTEVTAAEAAAMLGAVPEEALLELADGLERADGRAVYPLVDLLINEGTEPRQLARDLGEHFRALLMAEAGALPADTYSAEIRTRLDEQAARFGTARLVAALESLAQADKEMRWSDTGRVVLEVALARLMMAPAGAGAGASDGRRPPVPAREEPSPAAAPPRPSRREPASQAQPRVSATARVEEPSSDLTPPPPAAEEWTEPAPPSEDSAPLLAAEAAQPAPPPEEYNPFELEELPPTVTTPKALDRPEPQAAEAPAAAGEQLGAIRGRWNVVLEELKRARAVTTSALLAEAEPIRCDAGTLVIGFRHGILREKWERGDHRQRLAAALQSVFQQSLLVRSEELTDTPSSSAGSGPDGARRPARGSSALPPPTPTGKGQPAPPAASGAPVAASRSGNGADALEGQPLLHEIIATFEGQIVDPNEDI